MRNKQVFQLARALKGILKLRDSDPQGLRSYVQQWHSRALPHIRTQDFAETWIDFLCAWPKVHTPLTLNLMENAMEAARANPVEDFPYDDNEGLRDLVTLCRELQAITQDKPFWLSTRTAGRLLGIPHTKAWRWLYLLDQEGWIKTVEKGGTPENRYRATRFRYIGGDRTGE